MTVFSQDKFIDLVNNTIDINIESKMIDSRPTHLIIKKYL